MAKHEVTRDRAVALFMAMGFKTCDDWDDPKLLDRLGKVAEIVPDEFDPDPDLAELCLGLMKAAEKKDVIVFVDDPEVNGEGEEEAGTKAGPDRPDVALPESEPDIDEDPEPDGEPGAEVVEDKPKTVKPKTVKPKKDKPKKDKPKATKKRGESGPKIDGDPVGIRSIRNRLFCAGQVIREKGLEHGLSEELIKEVDEKFGKDSKVAAKNCLWSAWHALNGYLNG